MDIKKLILDPDRFFKDLSRKEPSLTTPFLIVLASSILGAINTYYTSSVLMKMFPPDIQSVLTIITVFSIIFAIIGVFVSWLLIAGIAYLISMVFNGEGSFKRTLEFIGYGFFPNLIGILITIPIVYYFLSNIQLPTLTKEMLEQIEKNPDIAKEIISSLIPDTMSHATFIINIAVTLWNLALWTYGIKYARNLDTKSAFIVALITTVLLLIYQLLI